MDLNAQLEQMIEETRRREQVLGPLRALIEQQRSIEDLLRKNALSDRSKVTGEVRDRLQELARMTSSTFLRERDQIRTMMHGALLPTAFALEQITAWDVGRDYLSAHQGLRAGLVWVEETRRMLDLINVRHLGITFPDLADRILIPSGYFTSYARGIGSRLGRVQNKREGVALQASLELAEAELSENSSLTEAILGGESAIEMVQPTSPISYNLYEAQEHELILLIGRDGSSSVESIPSLFDLVRSRGIARLTQEVVRLLATCNQESRFRNGADIFKVTNVLVTATTDLQHLIVKDNGSLGTFVGHLGRILYEGAGADHLRFLKANGGCLEPKECDVVWTLKTLRNKGLTHDPEHGDAAAIRAGYSALGNALKGLGLEGLPTSEKEFIGLQKRLLEQVREFLTLLLSRIRGH